MIPVVAPHFLGDDEHYECRNERELAFIEALHARAVSAGWYGLLWERADRVLLSVCLFKGDAVARTLRVDFDGSVMCFGDDETHQLATDLDPSREDVVQLVGDTPEAFASTAADWIERELGRWISTH